ncbi:hypothetical protein CKM354_001044500 [Cercospora kikuchii]|uniref:Uncharacterized protein n=1 Tax=Cercospora kikuchii TaxID=84275 RepID=A0A9P3CQ87_9PEZI|nr:uncharacterized protein CKM354_001044500 [Cercospora kikuchii]GIZ47352.1 hypothetical protein CKM354_001044500 [Cercospora kikuchii]
MSGLSEDEYSLSNREDGAGNDDSIESLADDSGPAPPINESDELPPPPWHPAQLEPPPTRPALPTKQGDELNSSLSDVPRQESPPSDRKDSAATLPLHAPDKTRLYAFFEQKVALNPNNKILLGQPVGADDKQTRYEFMLILVHYDNDQGLLRSTARARDGTKSVTTEILGFRLWKCLCELKRDIGITPHAMFGACKAAAHFYHLPKDRALMKLPNEQQKNDIQKMLASGRSDSDCSDIETRTQNYRNKAQTLRDLNELQGGPAPPKIFHPRIP